jgi:hypothetical protein
VTSSCPVCSGALARGDLILVCVDCCERLGGAVRVGATGEYHVSDEVVAELGEHSTTRPRSVLSCSWCSKPSGEVRKLLGTGAVAICDGCVALCAAIMEAELGPDWR